MKERLAVTVIWILIIADLLTGLLFNLDIEYYRIGLPLKSGIILFLLLYYISLISDKTILSIYIVIASLLGLWLIGSLISYSANPSFDYIYSFVVLNRYFFFLILSCVFFDLKSSETFIYHCKQILEWFFLFNNSLIFLGFIFNIDTFSTYDPQWKIDYDQRFGYKGLIHGGNDVAGIYILGVAYFFREQFQQGSRKSFLLITTCMAALLTGTKATLIAVIIISIYYLVRYRIKFFVGIIVPLVILGVVWIYGHWNYVKEEFLSSVFKRIEEMNLITYLFSGRDSYIRSHFKYISLKWTVLNHLAGDGFLYSETDLLDLYFFFGIIGLLIYLFFYGSVFFIFDKSLDAFFVFAIILAIAFTAGHIIQSATVPLFFLLYIFSANRIIYDKSRYNSIS
jgi:hypothetical protein